MSEFILFFHDYNTKLVYFWASRSLTCTTCKEYHSVLFIKKCTMSYQRKVTLCRQFVEDDVTCDTWVKKTSQILSADFSVLLKLFWSCRSWWLLHRWHQDQCSKEIIYIWRGSQKFCHQVWSRSDQEVHLLCESLHSPVV